MKLIVSLTIILGSIAFAQTGNKINIAMMDLEAHGISENESHSLANRLRGELVKTGTFTIVERGKMNEILNEQGFQQSGCTSDECAVEVGRLLNVKQIATGSVGKVGSIYTVSIRLIDVQSGEIINTVNEDCGCPIEQVLTKSMRNAALKLSGKKTDEKSTAGAFFRSVAFPGWGQSYQDKSTTPVLYPILFLGSAAGAFITVNNYNTSVDDYAKSRSQYLESTLRSDIDKYKKQMDDDYKTIESAEKVRNIFFIVTGVVYAWNLLDAVLLSPRQNFYNLSVNNQNGILKTGIEINW
jgi:TolB-like protein